MTTLAIASGWPDLRNFAVQLRDLANCEFSPALKQGFCIPGASILRRDPGHFSGTPRAETILVGIHSQYKQIKHHHTMWRFPPTAPEVTASELTEIRPPDGSQNFLRLLGRSPASLNAFLQAQAALARGVLTERQREEIALAVAEINGSKYCLALHEQKGRQAGMTPTEIRRSEEALADTPKAQAVLHFVQAAVLQRGEVGNEDFAVLRRAGFSDEQIIEVLANVVINIFSNYFNLIAQTELETSRTQVDQSLCSPGTAPGGTDRNTMVNPR